MTTLSSYLPIANNLARWQAIEEKQPQVATATKYFEANIGNVKSISDLVNNSRLFNYAMTAFGLGDKTYAKGLMTKVLEGGVTSSSALANKLNGPNIKAFAKAFDFADNGASTTASSALVSTVVNRYAENALETDQGQQNPGVQLALYFQRNAPNITNIYGILADKNVLTVVQTALGISPLTAAEPIDTQAAQLKAKLNIADFQDPKKLQTFISRFAANYDANNSSSSSSSPNYANALTLGATSTSSVGIDPSLLLAAANSRMGSF